jgi:hypothetical protein
MGTPPRRRIRALVLDAGTFAIQQGAHHLDQNRLIRCGQRAIDDLREKDGFARM